MIAASITEFGWTIPILVDEKNQILAGHARWMVAQEQEIEQVPTITKTGLTKIQKRAYVIADNKLTEVSHWDNDALARSFEAMLESDFSSILTGFTQGEIDYLVQGPTDPAEEWAGMPGFDQDEQLAFHTIQVHLVNAKARKDFAKLIDQPITEKTKFIWYPQQEPEKTAHLKIISDE